MATWKRMLTTIIGQLIRRNYKGQHPLLGSSKNIAEEEIGTTTDETASDCEKLEAPSGTTHSLIQDIDRLTPLSQSSGIKSTSVIQRNDMTIPNGHQPSLTNGTTDKVRQQPTKMFLIDHNPILISCVLH